MLDKRGFVMFCRMGKYKLIEGYPGMYDAWYEQPKKKSRRNSTLRQVRKNKKSADEVRHMNYTQLFNLSSKLISLIRQSR